MIHFDEMEDRWIADTRPLTFYEFVEAEEQAERDRIVCVRQQSELATQQAAQAKLLAAAAEEYRKNSWAQAKLLAAAAEEYRKNSWGGNQMYFTPSCQTLTIQMPQWGDS